MAAAAAQHLWKIEEDRGAAWLRSTVLDVPSSLLLTLLALVAAIGTAWCLAGLVPLASRLIYGRRGPSDDSRFGRFVQRCRVVFALLDWIP
jgi:hypothetical protein